MNNNKNKISRHDLIEAIKQSGYLLESEIANTLARRGFFIETNQVIEDPITGKSREIDLIAEYYDKNIDIVCKLATCAKIKFVFEIKNNIYPLVLMTRFEFSPNIEIWESTKEIQTLPDGIEWDSVESFYEMLLNGSEPIFTQYCSFEFKKGGNKGELLATHPEQVYTGLSKITYYCEKAVQSLEDQSELPDGSMAVILKIYHKFLFLPVLLINEDLFELEIGRGNKPILHKVEESRLVFNYYFKNEPRISMVWVVTKKGFKGFIDKMIEVERKVESKMIAVRQKKEKV